jgi:NAD(P)H-hydrate repair Nnr-like enzyme with NAD(P)H-hydrate epimerase domain
MQRAAAGLAAAVAQRLGRVYGRPVVLLVGGGDNGATRCGRRVRPAGGRAGERRAGRGAARGRAGGVPGAGGRVVDEVGPGLVVDGLVGIGGRGPLRHAHLAEQVRDREVVAVDLPSGVDADTGEVAGPPCAPT